MKKILLMAIIIVGILSSCVKPVDIKVLGFEGMELEGVSKITMKLKVENLSGAKLKLRTAKFSLVDSRGSSVADFLITEEVVIPKRATSTVEIPIRMKFNNPLLLISIASNFPASLEGYTIRGEGVAKAGMVRKKFVNLSFSVSDIMRNFEDDMTKILNELTL